MAVPSTALAGRHGHHGNTPAAGDTPPADAPPPAQEPPPSPQVQEARERFDQGELLFNTGNFGAALTEFQRAYELLDGNPSQYTVLLNLAQCYERLFRYEQAVDAYERYLRLGGDSAPEREQVTGSLRTLENLIATITVRTNAPHAQVWLDDRQIGEAPGPMRISSGHHVLELRADDFVAGRQEIDVPARSQREIAMDLSPLPHGGTTTVVRRTGLSPAVFGVGVGLTVVCLGVGIGFGVDALEHRASVNRQLADPSMRFNVTQDDQTSIRRSMTAADVMFGGAVVFGIASTIAFLLMDHGGSSTETPAADQPPHARVRVAPLVLAGGGGLSLVGVIP